MCMVNYEYEEEEYEVFVEGQPDHPFAKGKRKVLTDEELERLSY